MTDTNNKQNGERVLVNTWC